MIDLHIHSIYSDGSDTVKMILEQAQKLKLEAISITDHDNIDAYHELENYPELKSIYKGKLITGTELLAVYKNNFIEILGYGFDKDKLKINKVNDEEIQELALTHLLKVAFNAGVEFKTRPKLKKHGHEKIAYYVFIKELLINGLYYKLFKESDNWVNAFYYNHYTNISSPYYFDETIYYNNAYDIIKNIHNSGGLTSLAHPFMYPNSEKYAFIEEMVQNLPIDIIECFYPKFNTQEIEFLKELCKKYNKYLSGGSDCHGLNRPSNHLGTGIENNLNITFDIVKPWLNSQKNLLSLKK